MNKKEFKLFPCIICTLGFNSFVAVNNCVATISKFTKKPIEPVNNNDKKEVSPIEG